MAGAVALTLHSTEHIISCLLGVFYGHISEKINIMVEARIKLYIVLNVFDAVCIQDWSTPATSIDLHFNSPET
jgi:hypothetical protein